MSIALERRGKQVARDEAFKSCSLCSPEYWPAYGLVFFQVDRLSLETGVQMCTDHPSLYRFPSLSVFLVFFFYFPSSHTH